jgi:hypothetical protein
MSYFEEATVEQLQELLSIVDSEEARNWDWLLSWVYGEAKAFSFTSMSGSYEATPGTVVSIYSNEAMWESWQ